MCPMQINLTESSRIDSELRGWFHAPGQPKIRLPIDAAPAVPHVQSNSSKHELAKVDLFIMIIKKIKFLNFYFKKLIFF